MRKIIFSSLLLISVVYSKAQIPTEGLVGYWPFNGNANDESGNGNDGVINGASLTKDRFGSLNSAFSFDGSSNSIIISFSKSLNTDTFSGITLSAWCKFNDLNSPYNILSLLDDSPRGFTLSFDNSVDKIYGTKQYNTAVYSLDTVDTSQWYNIIYILDTATKISKLYLNNVFQGETTNDTFMPKATNLYIGVHNSESWGYGWYMNGRIDDIRIYNRALSVNEIGQIYYENKCSETVYDTIKVTVHDTIRVTIHDTLKVSVQDTLKINVVLTGIEPPDNLSEIKVYPNPTKDKLFINLKNFSLMNNYKLKIIDLKSDVIWQTNVTSENYNINMNTFGKTGLYFLQIINSSSVIIETKKIILY